MLATEQKHMF